ncbi:MAG TPA: lipoprotein [Methylophilus sp.]|nr:lipoprotein [Methylophilus sp.]HQQ33705.1 lipoprotein [Methylophilus sp.]
MRKLINIFLFTVYFLLTACGTKGPLYIPEQRYPQKTEAPEKSGSQEIAPANQ